MRTLNLAMCFLCVISVVACGDDDGDPAGSGGSSATGGSGGSGGTSGTSGTGGSGGTGGFASIMCGTTTCQPSSISPACCTDPGTGVSGDPLEFAGRAPNQCGTDLGAFSAAAAGLCLQLNQPGMLDDACPPLPNTSPGQPPLPGCCTDEGFCGGYEAFLPLGCTYPGTGRGAACGADIDAGTGNDAGQ